MNLQDMFGIGVAGNFTGHLEQAGENIDFVGIKTDETDAPKGLFPFFLPYHPTSNLSLFPLSPITIKHPSDQSNLQVEPEMALICDIIYLGEHVEKIVPTHFGAFNDCSIRREGAQKISHKKHWGLSSKGISPNLIKLDSFTNGGMLDSYRIASFLKRDGIIYEYGVDSAVNSYSYFYDKLLLWITHKINSQCDSGPLECISNLLKECGSPKKAIITIGATRYTEFGESSFLKSKDEIFVILYPSHVYHKEQIIKKLENGSYQAPDISTLHQIVL